VAGYDLVKLQAGGFGGFGILTEFHLRLRTLPRFDLTLTAEGDRDRLTRFARDLEGAGLDAICCELFSPVAAAASSWVLAIQMAGAESAVRAEQALVAAHDSGMVWTIREGAAGTSFWHTVSHAMGGGAVSFRLGVLPGSLDEILDLLRERLDTGLVAAGAARGGLRWSGQADGPALLAFRSHLAAREIPMTLERAPWALRRAVGHFGAYREGVGPLVDQLRRQFDPTTRFQATLSGLPGD
jgi:FAD/FMN-containing dehydrogenase